MKNAIRTKILKHNRLVEEYNFGEALVFWLGDVLAGTHFVSPDQQRLVLEEFCDGICEFGKALGKDLDTVLGRGMAEIKRLPVCKIGFLDRKLVCMDGQAFFLDITTGEKVPATDHMPLETLAYNLTTLSVRYNNQLQKLDPSGAKQWNSSTSARGSSETTKGAIPSRSTTE
jgi:hypothetical protein